MRAPHITSLLFIYHTPTTRDPHSFPTRRSSDLQRRNGDEKLGAEDAARDRIEMKRAQIVDRVPDGEEGSDRDGQRRDRKSTRLNSSHTVISYAVFCLKKKKKREQQADQVVTPQR